MLSRLLAWAPKTRRLDPYSVFGAAVGGNIDVMRLVLPPSPPLPVAAEGRPTNADGRKVRLQPGRFLFKLMQHALTATESPAVYEYLSKARPSTKRPPDRYVHLLSHAERGNLDMVRYLLDEQGVDVNGEDGDYSGSALSCACRRGHEDVVDLLLARGADPNLAEDVMRSGMAVRGAAVGGSLSILRKLLAHGARVTGPYRGHERALVAAFETEHTEMIHLLIEHGAPLDKVAPRLVSSMLHLGYESMLGVLRGYGFEPERGANGEMVGHRWGTKCGTKKFA
ncbi:ankyrin [Apiospora saccharicola]